MGFNFIFVLFFVFGILDSNCVYWSAFAFGFFKTGVFIGILCITFHLELFIIIPLLMFTFWILFRFLVPLSV